MPPKFTETMFLDTVGYKGTRFKEKAIIDVKPFKKNKGEPPIDVNSISGKYLKFQKTLDGQRIPTQFDRKIAIRNK